MIRATVIALIFISAQLEAQIEAPRAGGRVAMSNTGKGPVPLTGDTTDFELGVVQQVQNPYAGAEPLNSFALTGGNRQVELRWQNENGEDVERFFLERSEDNHIFTIISEFPTSNHNAYHFVDGSVQNNRTYYYRIVSRSATGVITFHNVLSIVPVVNN